MVTKVSWHEAQRRIAEFVERASKGERILVENGDGSIVAIVGPEDLRRLEATELPVGSGSDGDQQYLRNHLARSGVTLTQPTRSTTPPAKRQLVSVEGLPISEQIIADRR